MKVVGIVRSLQHTAYSRHERNLASTLTCSGYSHVKICMMTGTGAFALVVSSNVETKECDSLCMPTDTLRDKERYCRNTINRSSLGDNLAIRVYEIVTKGNLRWGQCSLGRPRPERSRALRSKAVLMFMLQPNVSVTCPIPSRRCYWPREDTLRSPSLPSTSESWTRSMTTVSWGTPSRRRWCAWCHQQTRNKTRRIRMKREELSNIHVATIIPSLQIYVKSRRLPAYMSSLGDVSMSGKGFGCTHRSIGTSDVGARVASNPSFVRARATSSALSDPPFTITGNSQSVCRWARVPGSIVSIGIQAEALHPGWFCDNGCAREASSNRSMRLQCRTRISTPSGEYRFILQASV